MFDNRTIEAARRAMKNELSREEKVRKSYTVRYYGAYRFSFWFGWFASFLTGFMAYYFLSPLLIDSFSVNPYICMAFALLAVIIWEIGKRFFTKQISFALLNDLPYEFYTLFVLCAIVYSGSVYSTINGAKNTVYQPVFTSETIRERTEQYYNNKLDSLEKYKQIYTDQQIALIDKGYVTKSSELDKKIKGVVEEIGNMEFKKERKVSALSSSLGRKADHMAYAFSFIELLLFISIVYCAFYEHKEEKLMKELKLLDYEEQPPPDEPASIKHAEVPHMCDIPPVVDLSPTLAIQRDVYYNMKVEKLRKVGETEDKREDKEENRGGKEENRGGQGESGGGKGEISIIPLIKAKEDKRTRKQIQNRKSKYKGMKDNPAYPNAQKYYEYYCMIDTHMKETGLKEIDVSAFPKPDT